MWCQGRVVAFIKESINKHVYVKIEWSDKCVRDRDLKITRNQLKKTKWNPNVPLVGHGERTYTINYCIRDRFSIRNKSKTVALDVCEYMCDCMGELAS